MQAQLVERYTARRAAAETADQRRELREAIDIIARSRGDELLRALLESLDGGEIEEPPMTEAKAKQLLTVEDAYSDGATRSEVGRAHAEDLQRPSSCPSSRPLPTRQIAKPSYDERCSSSPIYATAPSSATTS
jgi:hypothetical protein